MKYIINDKEYDVQIIRKNNKNTYVRISDDLKIIVTTNYITLKRTIKKILDSNYDKLSKMLNAKVIQHEKADRFFYLGKYYDIIIDDRVESVELGDSYIKIKDEKAFNKWYKNELIKVFNERLMNNFEKFSEITKCPILKIRKMKTRWGVCNIKKKIISAIIVVVAVVVGILVVNKSNNNSNFLKKVLIFFGVILSKFLIQSFN